MHWLFTYILLFLSCGLAQAQKPMYDYYLVTQQGDTIREGIKRIMISYRGGKQQASLRYFDGTKKHFTYPEIKAFSFVEPKRWFLGVPSKKGFYHQVTTIGLLNDGQKPLAGKFLQIVGTCNGHTLYIDFVPGDFYTQYLVAEGHIVKYKLDGGASSVEKALEKLMPHCYQDMLRRIWPNETRNNKRPQKP
jgi:hypothetical protein